MDKSIQKIETYCFAQRSKDKYDFNGQLAKTVENLHNYGWTIKQISTTSFVWQGEPTIAYTLLMER